MASLPGKVNAKGFPALTAGNGLKKLRLLLTSQQKDTFHVRRSFTRH